MADIEMATVQVALLGIFEAISKALLPVFEGLHKAICDFGERVYPLLREEYEKAGAPYGPSDEGMWRYFEEEQKFQNAIAVYQETIAWRKALTDLRLAAR